MQYKINKVLRNILYPLRKLAEKFVNVTDKTDDTILFKAACLIASSAVEGDYFEFGVYKGTNFIKAYKIIMDRFEKECNDIGVPSEVLVPIKSNYEDIRFFAFDSFEGLPELKENDNKAYSFFYEGKFNYSINDFRNNLTEGNVSLDKVVMVEGFFADTCNEKTISTYNIKKASIVYIDCDLYESTIQVLSFIGPLLVDGSIIIFDDWYYFRGNPNHGQQKAFHEWKKNMNGWRFTEYQKEGVYINSFIVNKLDLDNS